MTQTKRYFRIDLESLRKEMKEDCKKIAPDIQSLSTKVSSLMSGIAETYTEVVDLKYRQGIERIEASHKVYSDGVSTNLDHWVMRFHSFASELETEYSLSTNSEKVKENRFSSYLTCFLVDLQIFENYQEERRDRHLQANLRIYPGSERLSLKTSFFFSNYYYFSQISADVHHIFPLQRRNRKT